MTDEYLLTNDALASNFLEIFAVKEQPAYLKEWMDVRSVITREFTVFLFPMGYVEGHLLQLIARMHVRANWHARNPLKLRVYLTEIPNLTYN